MSARVLYRATLPDGTAVTRRSSRVYTHVVAFFGVTFVQKTAHWCVVCFCGSLELAEVAVKRRSVYLAAGEELRIIAAEPVEPVNEPQPPRKRAVVVAIEILIDAELASALAWHYGASTADAYQGVLRGLLTADLSQILSDYQERDIKP